MASGERRRAWRACACLAAIAVVAFGGCTDKSVRICDYVHSCNDFVDPETCTRELNEAIRDGRTTEQHAIVCASCLGHNDGDCSAVVDRRNCDVSCSGITQVTQLFTTQEERHGACGDVSKACFQTGMESCESGLVKVLTKNPSLDQGLDACLTCIRAQVACVAPRSVDAGGDTGPVDAGCADGGGLGPTRDCADYVASCGVVCAAYRPVTDLFGMGQGFEAICDKKAVECAVDGAAHQDRDQCVAELAGSATSDAGVARISARSLRDCATCVTAKACDELHLCNRTCSPFAFPRPPAPDEIRDGGRDGAIAIEGGRDASAGADGGGDATPNGDASAPAEPAPTRDGAAD